MYGDLQVTIMTRQAEREFLDQREARLRRAGWYRLGPAGQKRAWWRGAASADLWARLTLALASRSLLRTVNIVGFWRRQNSDCRGHDGPPARACLPM